MCSTCELAVEEQIREDQRRRQAERVEMNLAASGLPRAYRLGERGFADVHDQGAVMMAQAVIAGEVRGLYLYGDAGDDKTTLASATLAVLIRSGMTGRYVNSAALLMDIQSSYGENPTLSRHDLVMPLISAHALVVDDLGKEKGSEHAAGVIYQILDGRYAHLSLRSRRALIIVSNFAPGDAAARFRDAEIAQPILRRISELTVPVRMGRE